MRCAAAADRITGSIFQTACCSRITIFLWRAELRRARERAHRNRRGEQPIEVEVRSLDDLEAALAGGAEAILLDNMSPEDVRRAVERCARVSEKRIPLECSGGIRLENVRAYADTGVDFISVGLLTHSPIAVDMSMRVVGAG